MSYREKADRLYQVMIHHRNIAHLSEVLESLDLEDSEIQSISKLTDPSEIEKLRNEYHCKRRYYKLKQVIEGLTAGFEKSQTGH